MELLKPPKMKPFIYTLLVLAASLATLLVVTLRKPRTICAKLSIDAHPNEIWEVLTQLSDYPTWNPYIVSMEGELKVGSTMQATLADKKGNRSILTPKVKTLENGQRIVMQNRIALGILLTANHVFTLHDNGNGTCTFAQCMECRGLLAGRVNLDTLKEQFERMNTALKVRVETTQRTATQCK